MSNHIQGSYKRQLRRKKMDCVVKYEKKGLKLNGKPQETLMTIVLSINKIRNTKHASVEYKNKTLILGTSV